eukprot:PhM_4_TR8289/c5_g1_i1/m.92563
MAKGRSVVLTTHHLEEVEALAHRVAIMDHGEIKCIGSLPHLRHKFGDGYEVNIKARDGACIPQIKECMSRLCPGGSLEEVHGERMTFQLPQDGTVLSCVFEGIEGQKDDLGITDYSITQTSLEQVFLRISQTNLASE